MRIALVNNFFFPRVSGSAHLTEALASGLAARGHDVLVLTSDQEASPGRQERDGYALVRYACRSLPAMGFAMRYSVNFVTSPKNVRDVFRTLDAFRPDVVHQHGQFFDLTWITSVWARRRHVPVVLTVHTALTHTDRTSAAVLRLADRAVVRPFIRIGRPTLVVVDQFMLAYVRRSYRLPEDRVRVLPLAVDVDRFKPGIPSDVRERLGIGERPLVLSIGHVIPLRDRLAIVEALPHMLQTHPDAVVVVVGTVYDERFLRRAEELGVAHSIMAIGSVPHDEVPLYVAAADIETHDLQGYGLGTASLEVMAAGVPVISVVRPDNFPGTELRNWQNIVLVPADDPAALASAMGRLIDDGDTARTVGAGERQFVLENFALPRVLDRHEELYAALSRTG